MVHEGLVQLAQAANAEREVGGPARLVEGPPRRADGALEVRLGGVGGDAAGFDRLWLFLAALAVVSAVASWRVDTRGATTPDPVPLIP